MESSSAGVKNVSIRVNVVQPARAEDLGGNRWLTLNAQRSTSSALQRPVPRSRSIIRQAPGWSVNQGGPCSDGTSAGRCGHALVPQPRGSKHDRSTTGGWSGRRRGRPLSVPLPLTTWWSATDVRRWLWTGSEDLGGGSSTIANKFIFRIFESVTLLRGNVRIGAPTLSSRSRLAVR